MSHSLESSLVFPCYCAFLLCIVFKVRFAPSRGFPQASLHRISKPIRFVKRFLVLFSEKNKAAQRFRTMRRPPWKMFVFLPGFSCFILYIIRSCSASYLKQYCSARSPVRSAEIQRRRVQQINPFRCIRQINPFQQHDFRFKHHQMHLHGSVFRTD